MKFIKTLAGILLFSFTLVGQDPVVAHSFNTWWFGLAKVEMGDKWFASIEFHERRAEGVKYQSQFLFRPGINYKINSNVEVAAGYTYVLTEPYGEQPLPMTIPENNIWEQILLKHDIGKVKLSHRYRLEHRFVGNAQLQNDGSYELDGTNYEQRFRYRFTAIRPISKNEKVFVHFFDEIWINLADNFMPLGLNQNWLYGGFGYKLSSKSKVELGFMNQLWKKGDGIHYESNPTLQCTFSHDFGGKK